MILETARRSKRALILALGTVALLLAALIPTVATAVVSDSPVDLIAVRGASQPVIASLSWSAPADRRVDYYRVVASTGPTGPFVSSSLVEGTSFDFTDGLGGIDYYFFVTAIDAGGQESAAAMAGPLSAMWAVSPHERSGVGGYRCLTCHSVHDAGADSLRRQELAADVPGGQCAPCHDGRVARAANITSGTIDSFGLPSGHDLPAETSGTAMIADCWTCHDTHGTRQDGRMLPAKKINGVAVSSAGNQLCTACHDSQNSWAGADYPSTAEPTRDATGYPVAGTWTGPDTYASSTNPHRLIAETTQTVVAGDPIRREQGDCRYCHTPHGSPSEYDGLRANYTVPTASTLASDQADGSSAALCYTCHGGTVPNGFAAAPGTDIKQFATAEATSSAGHTIVTAGGTLPVGAPLPCFECHNPHGSQRGNTAQISDERGAGLSTASAGGVRSFCFTCHTTSDTAAGWDSEAGGYAPVTTAEKVVGLPRDAARLRLPAVTAHEQADGRSCYDCHGNDYDTGGRNVHNPAPNPVALDEPLASQPSSGTVEPSALPTSTDPAAEVTPSVPSGSSEPSAGDPFIEPPAIVPPSTETSAPLLLQIGEAIVDLFTLGA